MRCLTLADALAKRGARSVFLSRAHKGNLFELVARRGYELVPLQEDASLADAGGQQDDLYASWLGCGWEHDTVESSEILRNLAPDWLVVDHYALDAKWEDRVSPFCKRLMVIDDLANRPHNCDLLLDQNLGRDSADYQRLLSREGTVLAGPQFALLGPRFSELRTYSLERRRHYPIKNVLISMGGVDQSNATAAIIGSLKRSKLPAATRITVVMGAAAPWVAEVRAAAESLPWQTEVVTNISNMAERMAESDVAIGAAGSTSWERCCLGLPTVMVVLADNQLQIAQALSAGEAALLIDDLAAIQTDIPDAIEKMLCDKQLSRMSLAAAAVTDGCGVERIVEYMDAI